jgi:FAD/FMN-containing dehydrogenase
MIHRPRSEQELCQAVRCAAARGTTIRGVGARHSFGAVYATDGDVVRLDRLRGIRDLPEGRVVAEAGVVLGDLARHLDRRGLALPNLGGITAQTVAGFVATGSDGGSLRHSFASSIASVRLVTAAGAVVEIDRAHPWFDAAGVSLGLLGMISSVTFECIPRYGVAGSKMAADFATVYQRLGAWANESEYLRVLWFPGIDHCEVWRAGRTAPLERARGVQRMSAAVQYLANAANFVGTRARRILARPLWRLFVDRTTRQFEGPWHEVLPQDEGLSFRRLPHVYSELWIDIERAAEAVQALGRYFTTAGIDRIPSLPVELYCAPPSRFWLSPGYQRRSLRVNLIHYGLDPQPPETMFRGPWEVLRRFDARPHWGKYQLEAEGSLATRRNQPRFGDFVRLRRELDPHGRFLTPYFARVFEPDARPAPGPTSRPFPDSTTPVEVLR